MQKGLPQRGRWWWYLLTYQLFRLANKTFLLAEKLERTHAHDGPDREVRLNSSMKLRVLMTLGLGSSTTWRLKTACDARTWFAYHKVPIGSGT